jgi:hypothetical protein
MDGGVIVNPDLQKELLARLDALAAKLGVAASDLWAIYMRQAHIEGVQRVIGAVSFLLLTLGLTCLAIKLWRLKKRDGWSSDWEIGAVLIHVISAITTAVTVGMASQAYSCLANPGYWVLQQLMHRG